MTYESALAALSDPRRRAIFEALSSGAKSVGEIAAEQPVSRPAVSQHLKVLEGAGLVRAQKAGQRRLYRVEQAGLDALRRYLDGLWGSALEAFAEEAAKTGPDGEKAR